MDVEVVTTTKRLEELRPAWEALGGRSAFYTRYPVVRAWWDANQESAGHSLSTLVAHNNGRLVGVAPLVLAAVRRRGRDIRQMRFASHGDYMEFVVDQSTNVRPETVLRSLLQHLEDDDRWDVLSLTNVPASSRLAHYLLKSHRYNKHFTIHVENPFLDLSRYGSFEDYAQVSSLKSFRKLRSRLVRDVGPRFVVLRGNESHIFSRMGRLHQKQRDHLRKQGRSERHSLFDDWNRVEFYRRLYEGDADTVTFGYEDDNGLLIGYTSCFVDDRRVLTWNTAYHPQLSDYRLGEVLLYDVIDHLFHRGDVSRFDLGAGRYPWKFRWTDQFTLTYRLTIRRDRSPHGDSRLGGEVAPLAATVSEVPETHDRGPRERARWKMLDRLQARRRRTAPTPSSS